MDTEQHLKQGDDFKEAALPLIKWLAENKNPHAKVIVTSIGAELLEGVRGTGEILDYASKEVMEIFFRFSNSATGVIKKKSLKLCSFQ